MWYFFNCGIIWTWAKERNDVTQVNSEKETNFLDVVYFPQQHYWIFIKRYNFVKSGVRSVQL